MLTYLIIIAVATLLSYISVKVEEKTENKKIIYLMKGRAILFPAVIAGIRYNVGTDYAGVYEPLFEKIKNNEELTYVRTMEIGYVLLNRLVVFFGGSFNIVMFISSLITMWAIYMGIEHYKNRISMPLAVMFFMIILYQKSFNLVRQLMAMAIVFYGFKFLDFKEDENKIEDEKYKQKYKEKGKDLTKYKPRYKHNKEYYKYIGFEYVKYIICVLVAACFQRTSLVMLAIPFIHNIYTNPRLRPLKIASYIALLIIILNFGAIGKILEGIPSLKYYANYFKKIGGADISVAYYIRIIPAIIPYLFLWKKINEDKQMSLLFGLNIVGSILLLLGYLTDTYGERLSLYFTIFQIILFPFYIRCFKENKKLFIGSIVFFTVFNLAIWFYDYIYKRRDETIPYQTVFNKEEVDKIESKRVINE